LALLHRRPGAVRKTGGSRLPDPDALGRPHRYRPGADQPLRAAHPAGAAAPHHPDRRRRHRRPLPRRPGHGAGLRRGAAQFRRGRGGGPGDHGPGLCPRRRRRAPRLRGRPDAGAGQRQPQHPGGGHPVLAPVVSGAAKPVVLAIGGSDCSGMAGTAMDLRVIRALGGHGAAAVTAVTAQHGGAVTAVNPVAPAVLHQQLGACRALPIGAVKIGLVATPEQVRVCADFLRATGLPSVLDPVMASSAGSALMAAGTVAALRRELLPLCTIATPNHGEAERLAGRPVAGDRDAASAGEALRALGAPGLLVKGGHGTGPASCDLYLAGGQRFWLHSPRLPTPHSRGTGCALASAIATALALGHPLADAVVIAKMAINQGLRQGRGWDDHPGPVDISHFPDDGVDLPMLLDRLDEGLRETPFPGCGALPLGLYPVVDRAHWLATLLPAGVTTIQLRIKDLDGAALRAELGDGIALARRHGARLFINDHWQLAIEL